MFFFHGHIESRKADASKEQHITRSENFEITGGTKEEHDALVNKAIELCEKLKTVHPSKTLELIEQVMGS